MLVWRGRRAVTAAAETNASVQAPQGEIAVAWGCCCRAERIMALCALESEGSELRAHAAVATRARQRAWRQRREGGARRRERLREQAAAAVGGAVQLRHQVYGIGGNHLRIFARNCKKAAHKERVR